MDRSDGKIPQHPDSERRTPPRNPTTVRSTSPVGCPRARDARPPLRRGPVLASFAVVIALLLLFPRLVPNSLLRLGSLLEVFLPWLGLAVIPLLGLALLRRAPLALVALLLPVLAWSYRFGPLLLPAETSGHGLLVVQHNVSDVNADPAGTARSLAAAGPDLIALEELVPAALPVYEKELAARYPYHVVQGTVGLWSRYPLREARAVDIRPNGIEEGWKRGLRAVVRTPDGELAAYVAHLPSVRVGAGGLASQHRDESARLLGRELAAEEQDTVLLMGDLNATVDDRGLDPLTSRLSVPERGMAFSFPKSFPLARIDQVLARGADVNAIRTLPATGSDHLPVAGSVMLNR